MQTSFTAGEFSPLMSGHVNLERWKDSALKIENLIPLKQGPVTRRGGTKYISEVKDSSDDTVLMGFEFNVENAYQVEVGDAYFRFYTQHAQIQSGGSPYEIVSPYAATDLLDSNKLPLYQTAQSADVMFIVHSDYAVRSLNRTTDTNWSVNTIEFNDGPYLPENDSATTLTLSGTTGSVTVTASADAFVSTDVGRLIRWKDPANDWTWLEITAYTSTTVVTALIKGDDPSAATATLAWRLGVYGETNGYPKVITFFQDRIFLAGCDAYPDRYDLGKSGGYSSTAFQFAPSDKDGTVTDDAAFTGTLQSGKVNVIQWASADEKGLIIGTAGREWLIRASAVNEVLTPSNAKADPFSSTGSAAVPPIHIENGTIFLQRARRKIHDVVYSFERDQLKPRDITIASEHKTLTGVAEMKFQQEPINNIWMRRTDGKLIGITYYPDEAVFAAHGHTIGGTDVVVTSISVTPCSTCGTDELWMIVERTINGATKKYIEYMVKTHTSDEAKDDAIVMDSTLTYSGVAANVLTGLGHLEGETVSLMVNGNSHPDLVVASGSVTLENDIEATKAHVGLGNSWALKLQRIEAGAKDGVAQGKIKRITGYVVRLLETLGLKYGVSETEYDEYSFEQGQSYDESVDLFTGDTEYLRHPYGYDQDGSIYLHHDGVFPVTILAVMPQVSTQDR